MNNIFSKKSNVVCFCFILFLLILICFFENKNLNDKTKILDTTNEKISTTLILTTSEEDFFKIEEEEFKMCQKVKNFYDYLLTSEKLIEDYLPKEKT